MYDLTIVSDKYTAKTTLFLCCQNSWEGIYLATKVFQIVHSNLTIQPKHSIHHHFPLGVTAWCLPEMLSLPHPDPEALVNLIQSLHTKTYCEQLSWKCYHWNPSFCLFFSSECLQMTEGTINTFILHSALNSLDSSENNVIHPSAGFVASSSLLFNYVPSAKHPW